MSDVMRGQRWKRTAKSDLLQAVIIIREVDDHACFLGADPNGSCTVAGDVDWLQRHYELDR